MEKVGAEWSSEMMTRRPFLSLTSVNLMAPSAPSETAPETATTAARAAVRSARSIIPPWKTGLASAVAAEPAVLHPAILGGVGGRWQVWSSRPSSPGETHAVGQRKEGLGIGPGKGLGKTGLGGEGYGAGAR